MRANQINITDKDKNTFDLNEHTYNNRDEHAYIKTKDIDVIYVSVKTS